MTTPAFSYQSLPMRVIFGAGAIAGVRDEVAGLGISKPLVLCAPEQRHLADRVAVSLGDSVAGVYEAAAMHVPVEVAQAARRVLLERAADGCVAVGGGSTTGLAKAIALRHGTPVIAIPTTYAGSEMTPVWGMTENGRKTTGRDPRVLPASVIYDPELTTTLPVEVSVSSGLNAIAHAVEALYAPDASPIVSLMAEDGVRALAAALPAIATCLEDLVARGGALYGAWLCGACLGQTTMSLHHQLCHILGGTFGLPHAQTHAVLLPHVAAYNLPAAPAADQALRRALGTDTPAKHLQELGRRLGVPQSLADLGIGSPADLEIAIRHVIENPYANPRPTTAPQLRELLAGAWSGAELTR